MSEGIIVRSADIIAAEINAIKDQVKRSVLAGAVEIGKRLNEVRTIIPHGAWGDWLEKNVDYSERTAQNLLRVYETYGERGVLPDISYSNAVALLGVEPPERDALIESGAADLPARQLQDEIDRIRDQMAQQRGEMTAEVERLKGQAEKAREAAFSAARRADDTRTKLKADLKAKSDEADAAQTRADRAERKAQKTAKSAEDLERKLQDAIARAERAEDTKPEIIQHEIVPQTIQAELDKLREVARKAPSETVIKLRAGYERLTSEFRAMEALLGALTGENPGEAAKYRAAIAKAARLMAEKMER
ncbi:MAG: DUF3102 domain-containing protein [Clostridia bacterium]